MMEAGHTSLARVLPFIPISPGVSVYQRALRDAIKLAPYLRDVCDARGGVPARAGRHAEAVEDFTRAIMLEPDASVTLMRGGRSYVELGELEKAVEDYTAALEAPGKASSQPGEEGPA